jgi:VWFA-related protein
MRGAPGAAALVAVLSGAAAAATQQPSVFKSGVDVVFVDVAVTSHRVPVRGLTSSDFTLTDNGVKQDLEAVVMESMPMDVTLLLDVSGSVETGVLQGLKRAVDDTAQALSPRDRVRLLTFSHEIRQMFPYRPGGTVANWQALTAGGATSIYDALAAAMMQARPAGTRQMILVFTDGADSRSFMDAPSLQQLSAASDAVVHFAVGLRRGVTDLPHKSQLTAIAEATGGDVTTFRVDNAIPSTFRDILDKFRTSYVLRYTPQDVPREGWHALTVKVGKGNYEIKAKKGWQG